VGFRSGQTEVQYDQACLIHSEPAVGLDLGRRDRALTARWIEHGIKDRRSLAAATRSFTLPDDIAASSRVWSETGRLALLLGGHSRTLRRTPAIVTLIALAALGLTGARLGGANQTSATVRVTAWGAIAMAVTYLIGTTVGTAT
jgi:hypothetical protein